MIRDRWEGVTIIKALFGSKAVAKHPLHPERSNVQDMMAAEVKFKYPQPFTWAQAMDLDVGTISQGTRQLITPRGRDSKLTVQEITRLQHSLDHLKSTQDQLQYLIDTTSESTPDPDFIGAIQENLDVMCEALPSIGRGVADGSFQKFSGRAYFDSQTRSGSKGSHLTLPLRP